MAGNRERTAVAVCDLERNQTQKKPVRGLRGLLSKFHRSGEGTVTTEFAFLALPFFLIIGFITEIGISYTARKVLNFSVDKISRDIRTGEITFSLPAPEEDETDEEYKQRAEEAREASHKAFKDKLCENFGMEIFFTCSEIEIDVQTVASWADRPEDIDEEVEETDEDGNVTTSRRGSTFAPGGRLTVNVVRAYYEWTTIMDFNALLKLSYNKGSSDNGKEFDNTPKMFATAAFLTEPF